MRLFCRNCNEYIMHLEADMYCCDKCNSNRSICQYYEDRINNFINTHEIMSIDEIVQLLYDNKNLGECNIGCFVPSHYFEENKRNDINNILSDIFIYIFEATHYRIQGNKLILLDYGVYGCIGNEYLTVKEFEIK